MSTYLWPTIFDNYKEIDNNYEEIESFFNKLFSPYKVIYSSRARHFIPLILKYLNFTRNNIIFTTPYSSHCVLSSISYQSTPITKRCSNIDASIIYHHYGNTYKTNYNNIIIEDSVDSFILDVNEKSLFPNGADFSIISLAKILPISFGGILICKNEKDYVNLKRIYHRHNIPYSLKNIFCKETYLRESILEHYKGLSPKIDDIEQLYQNSKKQILSNYQIVSSLFNLDIDISQRLPSNILSDNIDIIENKHYKAMNITETTRHIYNYDTDRIEKKVLIPIHANCDWEKVV